MCRAGPERHKGRCLRDPARGSVGGLQLSAIFDEWIDALAAALTDGGLSRSVPRARAEDAVMRIEGR